MYSKQSLSPLRAFGLFSPGGSFPTSKSSTDATAIRRLRRTLRVRRTGLGERLGGRVRKEHLVEKEVDLRVHGVGWKHGRAGMAGHAEALGGRLDVGGRRETRIVRVRNVVNALGILRERMEHSTTRAVLEGCTEGGFKERVVGGFKWRVIWSFIWSARNMGMVVCVE